MEASDLFSETMELPPDDIEWFYIESQRVTDRRKMERDNLRKEISILEEEKEELRKENRELRIENQQLKKRRKEMYDASRHCKGGGEEEGDVGGCEHGDEETVTFAESALAGTLPNETEAPGREQVAFLQSSRCFIMHGYYWKVSDCLAFLR